jgi:N-carbamoylputrescine amidase
VKRTVNLGLIQMSCIDDKKANIEKTVAGIERAAEQGAQIICTQELFQTPYFCQVMDYKIFDLAEEVDENSATIKELSGLAAELDIVLIAALFEKRTVGLYHNTAAVIDADGKFLGKYRKMHIPHDPGYLEKFYFTPGDLGYQVFKTKFADIGLLICWDQWYPEAARLTAMKGAEIIFIPTAIGYSPIDKNPAEVAESYETWQIVQRGHAVANACFIATVNRVGFEQTPGDGEGIQFWGKSFVANPSGQLIQEASLDNEEILVCPVDLTEIKKIRNRESFPFRDRRIDSYQDLTRLYSD